MDEQKIAEVSPKTTKMPRIRVSNTKKPFIFYLNLAKKYVNRYNNVELTALGKAIPTVVVISEILKSDGMATQNLISISTIKNKDESTGKSLQKAKIEIVMTLNEQYDNSKAKENILKKKNAQHKTGVKKTGGTPHDVTACKSQDVTVDGKSEVKKQCTRPRLKLRLRNLHPAAVAEGNVDQQE